MALGSYLEKFTPQIRADLAESYGVDLSEWLEQGRWKATLELIEQLPWASRFREAQMNDPEYADEISEMQLRQDDDAKDDSSPRISEFGPVEQRLTTLIELNKALLMWAQKNAGVKSPKKMKPEPSPRTLVNELMDQKTEQAGFEIAAAFGFGREDFFASAA